MVTIGMVLAGDGEDIAWGVAGAFVGSSVGVFVGAGLTVSSGGITEDTGVAVGALVGVAVVVGGWL